MSRRSMIALLTVAALAVSFDAARVSAATPGHAQSSGLQVAHRHFPRHNHRAFAPNAYQYMPYGDVTGADLSGLYTPDFSNYFTNPVGLFSMLRLMDRAIPRSAPLSCKHSVETKKVPSEDGGERTITITRC
jgi:hypothetical protein